MKNKIKLIFTSLFVIALLFFTLTPVLAIPIGGQPYIPTTPQASEPEPLNGRLSMGSACNSNSDCRSGDCEDSNFIAWNDNFCDCWTDNSCVKEYGRLDSEVWECIDDGPNDLDYCVSNLRGKMELDIKPKSGGQVFSEIDTIINKPTPQITIPGLNFSDIKKSEDASGNIYLYIPFLGNYLASIYKYAIVTAAVLAIVMIMINGIGIIISGGTPEKINQTKKRIGQAIIGLLLAVGSYTLLYALNPELVEFKNLKVLYIPTKDLGGEIAKINPVDATIISDPNFHHDKPGEAAKLTDANIVAVSQKLNLDQCLLWSFAHKESGAKLHAIGHDENYRYDNKPVKARKDFLVSGIKYSGTTFTAPATASNYDYTKFNSTNVLNDDKFNLSAPPDYGLDWRFSHGISFLQISIFPMSGGTMGSKIDGPNGPEWARSIYGRWYTVTDLLNPDTSLEAALRFITKGKGTGGCSGMTTAVDAFKCMGVSNVAMGRALQYYEKCTLQKNMTISSADKAKYPASGSH